MKTTNALSPSNKGESILQAFLCKRLAVVYGSTPGQERSIAKATRLIVEYSIILRLVIL